MRYDLHYDLSTSRIVTAASRMAVTNRFAMQLFLFSRLIAVQE
jgi:hypothetical protein